MANLSKITEHVDDCRPKHEWVDGCMGWMNKVTRDILQYLNYEKKKLQKFSKSVHHNSSIEIKTKTGARFEHVTHRIRTYTLID